MASFRSQFRFNSGLGSLPPPRVEFSKTSTLRQPSAHRADRWDGADPGKSGLAGFWPGLGPETRSDATGWSRDSVFWPEHPAWSRPGLFSANIRPSAKSAPGQKLDFSLQADIRYMGPFWVRAHGLMFGKVYILWVCESAYSTLSSPRNLFQENRT